MSNTCPIQPKEVAETYTKAGQIYADKVLAIRFDDVMERITEDDALEARISDYKESFISEMEEASYDPRGYDEQGEFYDKLFDGLSKKFPDVAPDGDAFDDFWLPALKSRFGQYFDKNKKAIAQKIVERRKWEYQNPGDYTREEYESAIAELQSQMPELAKISANTSPTEIAQRAGIGIGKILLKDSGDFILQQAKASSPDVETQKRYFVDTLDDWGAVNNDYIDDTRAWERFDGYMDFFEVIADASGASSVDDYLNDFDRGARQAFSDYFNRKTGTTSGVPKKGRKPFLLAKKAIETVFPSSWTPPSDTTNLEMEPIAKKPPAPLTEGSKKILEEYLKTKNLDIIFNNAENQEQEDAILMETIRLSEERRKA